MIFGLGITRTGGSRENRHALSHVIQIDNSRDERTTDTLPRPQGPSVCRNGRPSLRSAMFFGSDSRERRVHDSQIHRFRRPYSTLNPLYRPHLNCSLFHPSHTETGEKTMSKTTVGSNEQGTPELLSRDTFWTPIDPDAIRVRCESRKATIPGS